LKRLRIAITQRSDAVVSRDEVRDALDTRLSKLIWELGFLPLPLVSEIDAPFEYLASVEPHGILLSGGNDIGSVLKRDTLEQAALDYALEQKLPVLGICRGMQFINHYQGGSLRTVNGHTGVRHRIYGTVVPRSGRVVNSYHNQGILASDLGDGLEPAAWADDGVVEALIHYDRAWLGIMWHPERECSLCSNDKEIIISLFKGGK
jgi:gamma-glutamyl-gamma-aminobutyrate hydrolase PuuD